MTRSLALWICLPLLGCNKDEPVSSVDTYDPPDVWTDTEWVQDSEVPEPGDSESADSETDSDVPEPPPEARLEAQPAALPMGVGSQLQMRAVSFLGADGSLVEASWTSSDETLATVDKAGVVTALAAGSVTLTAQAEGMEAEASLEIRSDDLITVTVVDGVTGAPMEGARVQDADEKVTTDKSGQAQLRVPSEGAPWVMVYSGEEGWIPAVFMELVSREITVPLRPNPEVDSAMVALTGETDFSGCSEAAWDEVVVGLAAPSFQHGPLLFEASNWLGENRTVEFVVGEVELPANLYLQGYAEGYAASAIPGDLSIWTVAGPMPIADAATGISETADAVELLMTHMGSFVIGVRSGLSGSGGDILDVDLAPAASMSQAVTVEVPELSIGFQGSETPLLIALADEDSAGGPVPAGMTMGSGTATVMRAPNAPFGWSGEGQVMAYAELGGAGSGEGHAVSIGQVVDGLAQPPAWMDLPVMESFSGSTKEFSFTADERVALHRAELVAHDGSKRDYYFPGGAHSGVLPNPDNSPTMGWGRVTWNLVAVERLDAEYHGASYQGELSPSVLGATAHTVATRRIAFTGR